MRIISGIYKSRRLITPNGDSTRPTSDRARESLFNVLNNLIDFEDISVLDLFAGSGAFAFEALSRGANHATLIEKNRTAIQAIKENARALDVNDKIVISQQDVYAWLNRLTPDTQNPKPDLLFADPPYDDSRTLKDLPEAIFGSRLLMPDSIVIIEHRKGSRLVMPDKTLLIKELQVGEAVFTILKSHGGVDS
jgi:16S rRNA (guanine966-N2)-methyltransferase